MLIERVTCQINKIITLGDFHLWVYRYKPFRVIFKKPKLDNKIQKYVDADRCIILNFPVCCLLFNKRYSLRTIGLKSMSGAREITPNDKRF